MIQITQIKVPLAKVQQEVSAEALRRGILTESEYALVCKAAAKLLHRKESQLRDLTVKRRSIDARHKDAIVFSYTVTLCLDGEHKLLQQKAFQSKVTLVKASKQRNVVTFADTISAPVVVGMGPAGLFAALVGESRVKTGYFGAGKRCRCAKAQGGSFLADRRAGSGM